MVPVNEQIDTIQAISLYNQALPAKRKAKGESLPEIPTNNVVKKTRFVKELKKKELITVEKTSYHQIGMIDGGERTQSNNDQYSMAAK